MTLSRKDSAPAVMRWGWLNWPAPARRAVTLVFLVGVNWLLLAPVSTFREVHEYFPHQDKFSHLAIFGLLTGLTRWSIPAWWGKGRMRLPLLLALVFYGLATEWLQLLIPSLGRNFEWADLMFDSMGVALGLWLCERLAQRDPEASLHEKF